MLSKTALMGALCLVATAVAASAQHFTAGPIQIDRAWARPTPVGAPTGGGYLTLTNRGRTPDRLVSASSPVARRVELHETTMTGGVMRMRPLSAGVALAPGKSVVFQPGGRHLMLVGLARPLVAGQRIAMTLRFERAPAARIEVRVERVQPGGARGGMAGHE